MVTNLSIAAFSWLQSIAGSLSALARDERGQDLIEYAMLAGLIALAIIGAIVIFNGALLNLAGGMALHRSVIDAVVIQQGIAALLPCKS